MRYPCQDSLVVWVSERAGARLTVLRSANSGVTKEAGGTLLAELSLSVVLAALAGETIMLRHVSVSSKYSQQGQYHSDVSYCADSSLGVAGVRVAVAFAELAVAQV